MSVMGSMALVHDELSAASRDDRLLSKWEMHKLLLR